MPAVICTVCSKASWFRALKGARLADHRCNCGAKLTLLHKPRTRRTGPKITCTLCQRSGYKWFRRLTQPMTFEKTWRSGKHRRIVVTMIEESPLTVAPAGAIVCNDHIPVEIQELERIQNQEKDAFAAEHANDSLALDTPVGDAYEAMLARHRAEIPQWFELPTKEERGLSE